MLDTWQSGPKQKARARHILAIQECKNRLMEIAGERMVALQSSGVQVIDECLNLLHSEEAWRLNGKIRYHEIQANLWAKSIVDFGDMD